MLQTDDQDRGTYLVIEGSGTSGVGPGESKIADHKLSVVNQKVLRLQIAMKNLFRMTVVGSGEKLIHEASCRHGIETTPTPHVGIEVVIAVR